MRVAVLGLILVNLGFWSWVHWILPPPDTGSRYSGPDLVLIDESDFELPPAAPAVPIQSAGTDLQSRWSAVTAPSPDSAAAPVRDRCIAIGPFLDRDNIDEAIAALAAAAFEPAEVSGQAEVWDGYWIYVPTIPDMDTARDMLARFVAAGVDDAYIIPESDSGILISLGVFSTEARAAVRLGQVNALGIAATVADQTRTAEATWLELQVSDDEAGRFAGLRHPGQPGLLEQRDCAGE